LEISCKRNFENFCKKRENLTLRGFGGYWPGKRVDAACQGGCAERQMRKGLKRYPFARSQDDGQKIQAESPVRRTAPDAPKILKISRELLPFFG
jgi:hypothetical protein